MLGFVLAGATAMAPMGDMPALSVTPGKGQIVAVELRRLPLRAGETCALGFTEMGRAKCLVVFRSAKPA